MAADSNQLDILPQRVVAAAAAVQQVDTADLVGHSSTEAVDHPVHRATVTAFAC